jgi:hypothetical protein
MILLLGLDAGRPQELRHNDRPPVLGLESCLPDRLRSLSLYDVYGDLKEITNSIKSVLTSSQLTGLDNLIYGDIRGIILKLRGLGWDSSEDEEQSLWGLTRKQ